MVRRPVRYLLLLVPVVGLLLWMYQSEHRGRAGVRLDAAETPRSPSSLGIAPRPSASSAVECRIVVVDAVDGNVIPSASVTRGGMTVESVGAGAFRTQLPSFSAVRLLASASGYQAAARDVAPGTAEVRWPLLRIHDLEIRAREAGTGLVLANARVHLEFVDRDGEPIPSGEPIWQGATNSEGSTICPAGDLASVRSPRIAVIVETDVHVRVLRVIEPAARCVTIYLAPANSVQVLVRDEAGLPVAGADVRSAWLTDLRLPGAWGAAQRTDANGACRVKCVIRSEIRLFAHKDGSKVVYAGVWPESDSIELELPAQAPAGVSVVDSRGSPIAGVPVLFVPMVGAATIGLLSRDAVLAITDARGRATVTSFVATTGYIVEVRPRGATTNVSWHASTALRQFPEIRMPEARVVSVEVTSIDRAKLPECQLFFYSNSRSTIGARAEPWMPHRTPLATTDLNGRGELIVADDAVGHIVVWKRGFAPVAVFLARDADHVSVELDAALPIRVVVHDQSGESCSGVPVRLLASGMAAGARGVRLKSSLKKQIEQRVVTGKDGNAIVLGYSTEQYVSAGSPATSTVGASLAADNFERGQVELSIVRRRRLEVRLVDPDGQPLQGAGVAPRIDGIGETRADWGVTDAEGRTVVQLAAIGKGLPADTTLAFTYSGTATGKHVTQLGAVGESIELVAERWKSVEIDVVLLDSDQAAGWSLPQQLSFEVRSGDGRGSLARGRLSVGRARSLALRTELKHAMLRVHSESLFPVTFPLDLSLRRVELRLPTLYRVVLVNETDSTQAFAILGFSFGQMWKSNLIGPYKELVVWMRHEDRSHRVSLASTSSGPSVSFKVRDCGSVTFGPTGFVTHAR